MQFDFQTLMTVSPNPYVLLDRSIRIVWMNDAYLKTTMRKRDDILGRAMFDAFPADRESEGYRLLSASFDRVLRTGESDELALIRYDIDRGDGTMDARYWSATHTPLLDDQGQVTHILQHTVDVTELHGLRTLRDEVGIVERANRVQIRNLDLTEESQSLRKLVEQAPGFVAVLMGPDFRFVLANRSYRDLVGRDVIGLGVAEALPEVVEQGFVQLLESVRESATAFVGRQIKVVLEGRSDSGERYVDFVYQPIVADDGQISGIFVQGSDVTDQVEAQEAQRLLINELDHRVKNTLAIVQSLALQSFRDVPGSQAARETFEARLNALAEAHGLLTASNWESAAVGETIRRSAEATAGDDIARVGIDGPDLLLRPQSAVSLAMIVHELTTNAIKYGALSGPAGRVDIGWEIERDPDGDPRRLTMRWTERGGPPVTKPDRKGFGSRLIARGLSSERSSRTEMRYLPEGIDFRMTTDLASKS